MIAYIMDDNGKWILIDINGEVMCEKEGGDEE